MRITSLSIILTFIAANVFSQTTYKEWWVEVKPGKGQSIIENTNQFFEQNDAEFSSGGWAIYTVDTRGSMQVTHKLRRFGDYSVEEQPWSEDVQSRYSQLWQQNFSMIETVVKDQQALILTRKNYTKELTLKYPYEKVYEIRVADPESYLEAFNTLWASDDIVSLWEDRPYALAAVTTGHENSVTHRVHVSFENWRDMYETEERFFTSNAWMDYLQKGLEVEIISSMTSILRARHSAN